MSKSIGFALLVVILSTGCTAEHDLGESEYRQNVCLWLSQTDRPEIERDGWPNYKQIKVECLEKLR